MHHILNEIVMGGMVLETNMSEILTHIEAQNKIEKQEVCVILYCVILCYIVLCYIMLYCIMLYYVIIL